MLIPAGADYFREQPDFAFSFATSSAGTMFWGMLFVLAFKGMYKKTTTAQMYLATTLSWILVCSFAAIPFVFAPFSVSYTDIFFEATSGPSTMDATIYPDLDNCSDGIISAALVRRAGNYRAGNAAFAVFTDRRNAAVPIGKFR